MTTFFPLRDSRVRPFWEAELRLHSAAKPIPRAGSVSSRGRLPVTNDAPTRLTGLDIVRYSRIAVCVTSSCSQTFP